MGKFKSAQDDIFSIFASQAWKAENIKTFPSNFLPIDQGSQFLKISLIFNGSNINLNSISGVLIGDIFTSAGNGPNASILIADKLDQYLVGKSVKLTSGSITQFFESSLTERGLDKDNPTLFRSNYTIPFNFFGVSQ